MGIHIKNSYNRDEPDIKLIQPVILPFIPDEDDLKNKREKAITFPGFHTLLQQRIKTKGKYMKAEDIFHPAAIVDTNFFIYQKKEYVLFLIQYIEDAVNGNGILINKDAIFISINKVKYSKYIQNSLMSQFKIVIYRDDNLSMDGNVKSGDMNAIKDNIIHQVDIPAWTPIGKTIYRKLVAHWRQVVENQSTI